MAQLFGHEKLKVYQKGMEFVASRTKLLDGRFSGIDQARYLGIAYKATIQSASLVDMATAMGSAEPSQVEDGREMLRCIAAMLTSLSKVASHAT